MDTGGCLITGMFPQPIAIRCVVSHFPWIGLAWAAFFLLEPSPGTSWDQDSLRRSTPARPRMPEPNSIKLLGSGTVPVVVVLVVVLLLVPRTVKDSEGIVPTLLCEAEDGPEFSSQ